MFSRIEEFVDIVHYEVMTKLHKLAVSNEDKGCENCTVDSNYCASYEEHNPCQEVFVSWILEN